MIPSTTFRSRHVAVQAVKKKKGLHRSSHLDRACSQKASKEKEKARSFPGVETKRMIAGLKTERKKQEKGRGTGRVKRQCTIGKRRGSWYMHEGLADITSRYQDTATK